MTIGKLNNNIAVPLLQFVLEIRGQLRIADAKSLSNL